MEFHSLLASIIDNTKLPELVVVVQALMNGAQTITAPPELGGVDEKSGLRMIAGSSDEFARYPRRRVEKDSKGFAVLVCDR